MGTRKETTLRKRKINNCNEVNIKVRFTYKQGEFDLFFNVFKVGVGCRDPPYQFVFKNSN